MLAIAKEQTTSLSANLHQGFKKADDIKDFDKFHRYGRCSRRIRVIVNPGFRKYDYHTDCVQLCMGQTLTTRDCYRFSFTYILCLPRAYLVFMPFPIYREIAYDHYFQRRIFIRLRRSH